MHNSGAFLFMNLWIRTLYQVHDFISADIDFIKEIYLLCISKYFVMSKEYLEDLKEIKDIMNRSTRFISLSGISGILAGLIALLGLYFAHSLFYKKLEPLGYMPSKLEELDIPLLLGIACSTLFLAISLAVLLTVRKTKTMNQKAWNKQSKTLVINLAIPLVTGGLMCLILLAHGFISFLAPISLIFYGLGLVNASKYTLKEIQQLGVLEILLGLFAFALIEYSLAFWAIGFGFAHIVYGLLIHRKYSV